MTNTSADQEFTIPLSDGRLHIKYEPYTTNADKIINKKNTSPIYSKSKQTALKNAYHIKPSCRKKNYSAKSKKQIPSQHSYRNSRGFHELDVFISYSHTEDKRAAAPNWVVDFVQHFLKELQTRKGFKNYNFDKNIFFDQECLNNAQRVMPTIREKVKVAKLFIGLISESYLDSKNCKEEWSLFLQHNNLDEDYNNFFMIPIRPVEHEKLPTSIRDVSRSHTFCYRNNNKKHGPLLHSEKDQRREYFEKMDHLIDSVVTSLAQINKKKKRKV